MQKLWSFKVQEEEKEEKMFLKVITTFKVLHIYVTERLFL